MSWRDATCRLSSLTRYERALERFADPQSVIEMATYSSTDIASTYFL
jgi:hypothetical protein